MITRSWESTCFEAVLKSQIRLKRTFSNSNWPQKDEKLGYKFFSADLTSFWVLLTGSMRKGFRKKPCYTFKQARLSESTTSEILELWSSFFFSKHWKFIVDCKNAKKMSQKIYGFSDSLIYVGNSKFSLLIRELS